MKHRESFKTKFLDFVALWHGLILLPIHFLEIIGSVIGAAVIAYGVIAKEGSKSRNFLANVVFYGISAPFILLKAQAAWKGADKFLDQAYSDSKEQDMKRIHVVRDEKDD